MRIVYVRLQRAWRTQQGIEQMLADLEDFFKQGLQSFVQVLIFSSSLMSNCFCCSSLSVSLHPRIFALEDKEEG